MYLPTMNAACTEPLHVLFLGYGLAGMTKDERTNFVAHVKNCEPCQDSVRTELTDGDAVTQLLELRRRIG